MSTFNPHVTSVLVSGETTGWFILDTQLFKVIFLFGIFREIKKYVLSSRMIYLIYEG